MLLYISCSGHHTMSWKNTGKNIPIVDYNGFAYILKASVFVVIHYLKD